MKRNRAQMKNIETPDKELNEMEISNLSDAEFKSLVTRMLKELSENLKGGGTGGGGQGGNWDNCNRITIKK